MHPQAAQQESFERVSVVVRCGRKLKLGGVLPAIDALEEIPVVRPGKDAVGPHQERRIYAFLVRGTSLSGEGLSPGDQVLIEETSAPRPGTPVLAKVAGTYVLRPRPDLLFDGRYQLRVLGALIGIIRRRGFGRARISTASREEPHGSATKLKILRGQLGMLEATCANTRNPRLQDALRNEADRVRKQLQIGADINKVC